LQRTRLHENAISTAGPEARPIRHLPRLATARWISTCSAAYHAAMEALDEQVFAATGGRGAMLLTRVASALQLAAAVSLVVLLPLPARADVALPRFLASGAVLQRETAWKLWGKAAPGEKVDVRLDGKSIGTTIARSRDWSLALGAQPAGGPHRIEVIGKNRAVLEDVYFGDLWIASGQSNMELPMARVQVEYPDAVAQASFPLIRFFRAPKEADFDGPRSDFSAGQWQPVTPESVRDMSAVAFFFARQVQAHHSIPIGIIDNSYGGSAVESWMSEQALKAYPEHLEQARRYRDEAYLRRIKDADARKNQAWYADVDASDRGLRGDPKWFENDVPEAQWKAVEVPGLWQDRGVIAGNGVVWFRRDVSLAPDAAGQPGLLILGRIVDADTAYVNGVEVGHTTYQYPPRRYAIPAGLLRAGNNSIAVRVTSPREQGGFVADKPYSLSVAGKDHDLSGTWKYRVGVEAQPLAPDAYVGYKPPLGFYNALLAPLSKLRIKGVIWYQGETNTGNPDEYARSFPALIRDWRRTFGQGDFPFLYVQLADFMPASAQPGESQWAATREAQRLALAEPNTAMAVAIGTGEWNDIHPLRKKDIGERLALAARKLAYGEDVVYSGPLFRALEVQESRVVLSFEHVGRGLTCKGDRLRDFAVAGPDGRFVWAHAAIRGTQVVVHSDLVPNPTRVRYAWADNPDKANLYNQEGLPASPFEAQVPPAK
jgi:sialate O-acetylesterase